jgi:hypothetical protein
VHNALAVPWKSKLFLNGPQKNMKKERILDIAFIIGILAFLYGATQKILHSPNANSWLLLGGMCWLIFVLLAVYEVSSSRRLDGSEKTLWILGLLFMSGITGFLYVLWGRDRVRDSETQTSENF